MCSSLVTALKTHRQLHEEAQQSSSQLERQGQTSPRQDELSQALLSGTRRQTHSPGEVFQVLPFLPSPVKFFTTLVFLNPRLPRHHRAAQEQLQRKRLGTAALVHTSRYRREKAWKHFSTSQSSPMDACPKRRSGPYKLSTVVLNNKWSQQDQEKKKS